MPTKLSITPGGTVGADLTDSPANGKPDRSDTPAGDISHISKNINWLNGSYAGADIKVVAHLYGKTNKDQQIDNAKQSAADSKAVQMGIVNAEAIQSTITLASLASVANNPEAFFRSKIETHNQTANMVIMDELFLMFLGAIGNDYWPMYYNRCEQLKHDWAAVSKSWDDQAKAMTESNDNSSTTCVLENLQTLSVQTYREKNAVRSLGKSYVSGYVRGPRTIGGSMIFTMVQEHPLKRLINAMDSAALYGETQYDYKLSSLIADQMPPIDLTIVFANEYGSISRMGIYGVEFMTDGMTLSSEDMLTEVVCQFVARDIDVPTVIGMQRLNKDGGVFDNSGKQVSGSSLMMGSRAEYNEFLDKVRMRSLFKGR